MTQTKRTSEQVAQDISDERELLRAAFENLGNDVDEIMADMRLKAADMGRKALVVGPAVAAVVIALAVRRRRRRRKE